jgi:hypothetical protein
MQPYDNMVIRRDNDPLVPTHVWVELRSGLRVNPRFKDHGVGRRQIDDCKLAEHSYHILANLRLCLPV